MADVCDYINFVPTSPNVTFVLDKPFQYSAPLGTNLIYGSDSYLAPNNPQFTYPSTYNVPLGGSVDFSLTCGVSGAVYAAGILTLDPISLVGSMDAWEQWWEAYGDSTLTEISSVGVAPTDISAYGTLFSGVIIGGSVVERGNLAYSFAHMTTKISSVGYASIIPSTYPADLSMGQISSVGEGIVAVIVFPSDLHFSNDISFLRGRTLFGYPKAPIIRQIYELSNNRSLAIPNIPEDPGYAVFLTTTDYNLTDDELRRGTIDLAFTFAHDVKDIEKIVVKVKTPMGITFVDQMKIVDYPGGTTEDHVLNQPFKNTSALRVPIHCISKKENQFLVEIQYKNPTVGELDQRSRTMLRTENYIIPFQAQFDNRNPYVNIADHSFVNGPQATNNQLGYIEKGPDPIKIFRNEEDTVLAHNDTNPNIYHLNEYVLISKIINANDDRVEYVGQDAISNTYFIQEYVDLSSVQIGG